MQNEHFCCSCAVKGPCISLLAYPAKSDIWLCQAVLPCSVKWPNFHGRFFINLSAPTQEVAFFMGGGYCQVNLSVAKLLSRGTKPSWQVLT